MAKSKIQKEETFNWKGIKDNGDGTFDVADKRAKNRLMKEFRRQGIRSRSKRIGEKGYYVYPIGARKQRARGMGRLPRKERQYYPGMKPRTRFPVTGPRPQLRQVRPGFARPGFGGPSRPVIHAGPRRKGTLSGAIMKSAERRAQKQREEQRSPYTEEGKPRPGYMTYVDRSGTQRIIRRPTGTWRDIFMSKQQKAAVNQARVQESLKIESEMRERSKGQPSTEIPGRKSIPAPTVVRQRPAPAGVTRTSELPERKSEPKADYQDLQQRRVSEVQRTTQLPEPEKPGKMEPHFEKGVWVK